MTVLLVAVVLLPLAIWRQMHTRAVTPRALILPPLVFAVLGAAGMATRDLPTDGSAVGYLVASLIVSICFGVARGMAIEVWRDPSGGYMARGTRLMLALWAATIVTKLAMGALASATGLFPSEHTGEVYLFLAVTFAAQAAVVARRSLWRSAGASG
jgi:hypothetical protein